jgi:hypothetical protein
VRALIPAGLNNHFPGGFLTIKMDWHGNVHLLCLSISTQEYFDQVKGNADWRATPHLFALIEASGITIVHERYRTSKISSEPDQQIIAMSTTRAPIYG